MTAQLTKFIAIISAIHRLLRRLVGGLVAALLGWMVALALLQLLLRWTLEWGFSGADLQLRQLVLWVGLLGGVLAAADSRHIRIDILEHYAGESLRRIARRIVSALASVGCFYLAYLSIGFIASERAASLTLDRVFFGLTLPLWIVELMIPVGFGLMGVFFLLNTALTVDGVARARSN